LKRNHLASLLRGENSTILATLPTGQIGRNKDQFRILMKLLMQNPFTIHSLAQQP
jgi:hypothetical protein